MPAQPEQGHWVQDWYTVPVCQCNGCGAQFETADAFWAHSDQYWDDDGNNYHGSYTMVSGDPIYKEPYWVVDVPAQEEQGHWEYE